MVVSKIQEYLEVLGLSFNASKEDIKVAYRRMALKHHPDKTRSSESSAEFTKVKEAYEFLMAWDGPMDSQSINNWDDIFESLMSTITKVMQQKMSKTPVKNKNKTKQRKETKKEKEETGARDIKIQLPVTLEELYTAKVKKLLVKVKDQDFGDKQEELYISLFNYKPEYVFREKGDWDAQTQRRGNIVVWLDIQKHDLVNVDGIVSPYDLYIEFDVSLYDYYCRKYLALPFLNNELVEVEGMFPGQQCACIKNKGLPYYNNELDEDTRGALYVHFKLKLPRFESDDVPEAVKSVLKQHFVF